MYCEKCGKRIREEYGYCYKCGHIFNDSKSAAPQPQAQPQPQYQAPQPQYQAPQPQYQAPQPQYQAPQPQYEAPQPQAYPQYDSAPPKRKMSAFPFVSAGIMIMMILFSFLPWISIGGFGATYNLNLIQITTLGSYGSSLLSVGELQSVFIVMFICAMVSDAMCIPGTVLSFVRKKNLALGINIAASAIAFVPSIFYIAVAGVTPYMEPAAFVFIYVALAVCNIVFSVIARKKG